MVVEDRQELCDKFGDYFTNLRTEIKAETRNSEALVDGNSLAGERGLETVMEFRPCDSAELIKISISIRSSGAGLDGVNLKTTFFWYIFFLC